MRQLAPLKSKRSLAEILLDPTPIAVALHFRTSDAGKLWDLARRHENFDGEDLSMFAKAARATERGLPVVVECSVVEQLEELKSFFPRHGIEAPRMEELRTEGPLT